MRDGIRADRPASSSRPAGVTEAALTAAGAVFGALAKIADESTVTWASDLGDHPGMWVFIVAVIGWGSVTATRAAARAGLFSVAMCVGYYGWSTAVFGFGWGRFVFAWLALAVTAVPVGAAAAWWATRRGGIAPGAVMAGLAGLIVSGGATRAVWRYAGGHLPAVAVRPVQALLEVMMVAVMVTVLPRHGRTKLWALALIFPAWWMPDFVNWFVGLTR